MFREFRIGGWLCRFIRDIMFVVEGFELVFSLGIKDLVLDIGLGSMCVFFGFVLVGVDLVNKVVFCGFSFGFSLFFFGLEIGIKFGCILIVVGSNDMVILVFFYKIFKVFVVGGRGIWDRVVGKLVF